MEAQNLARKIVVSATDGDRAVLLESINGIHRISMRLAYGVPLALLAAPRSPSIRALVVFSQEFIEDSGVVPGTPEAASPQLRVYCEAALGEFLDSHPEWDPASEEVVTEIPCFRAQLQSWNERVVPDDTFIANYIRGKAT